MAVVTVETITQRIRDIYDVIDGLKVFQFVPREVTSTSLPCVIVWPLAVTPSDPRTGAVDESRRRAWLGVVLLEAARLGTAGQAETEAQDFDIFGKVEAQFWGRRRLQLGALDQGLVDNTILSDSGLILRPYPFNSETLYLGVDFTHTVNYVGYFPDLTGT